MADAITRVLTKRQLSSCSASTNDTTSRTYTIELHQRLTKSDIKPQMETGRRYGPYGQHTEDGLDRHASGREYLLVSLCYCHIRSHCSLSVAHLHSFAHAHGRSIIATAQCKHGRPPTPSSYPSNAPERRYDISAPSSATDLICSQVQCERVRVSSRSMGELTAHFTPL